MGQLWSRSGGGGGGGLFSKLRTLQRKKIGKNGLQIWNEGTWFYKVTQDPSHSWGGGLFDVQLSVSDMIQNQPI